MNKYKPELFIFAGINGAGKSTLARITEIDQKLHIVNPDVIAKKLVGRSNDLPKGTNLKAGRIALEERGSLIQEKKSFGFESTLTSKQDFKTINSAIENGFEVNLVYIGLNNAELAKDRVANRVKNGGHDIPKEVIERRYEKSIENLGKALKIVDNAKVYDNSENHHKLLFEVQNKKVTYENKVVNDWAKKQLNSLKKDNHTVKTSRQIFTETLKKVRSKPSTKSESKKISNIKKLKIE